MNNATTVKDVRQLEIGSVVRGTYHGASFIGSIEGREYNTVRGCENDGRLSVRLLAPLTVYSTPRAIGEGILIGFDRRTGATQHDDDAINYVVAGPPVTITRVR
jgi:hypothetical protein